MGRRVQPSSPLPAIEPLPERMLGDPLPSLPPPASSTSDELSWIIELLEKDGMAFQESLVDPGPFGENPFSPFYPLCRHCPHQQPAPKYLLPSGTLHRCELSTNYVPAMFHL